MIMSGSAKGRELKVIKSQWFECNESDFPVLIVGHFMEYANGDILDGFTFRKLRDIQVAHRGEEDKNDTGSWYPKNREV